jgi:hypothetical protein
LRFGSFDQALGKFQFCAKEAFAAGHLSDVDLVIVAGEMKQAVEDEDFDFGCKRVTVRG